MVHSYQVKGAAGAGDFICGLSEQCQDCRHFHGHRSVTGAGYTCNAFPGGIPLQILEGEHDHRRPFTGDNGVRFEPLPGRERPPPLQEHERSGPFFGRVRFWSRGEWCWADLTRRGVWCCPSRPEVERMLEEECRVDALGNGYRHAGELQLRRAAVLLAGTIQW